jgi:hypothetical protein
VRLIVAHVYDDATVPDATQAQAAALWRSSCSRAAGDVGSRLQ